MKSESALKRVAAPWLDSVALTASELSRRGWAEANAGNFSIRLSPTRLLVKRAGTRMRDLARHPLSGLCLVTHGSRRSHSSYPSGATPTSELPTHLAAQAVLLRVRPEHNAVLHTHPTALIALAHLIQDPKQLVRVLLDMHIEAPSLLGSRLTAIPFQPAGSAALAHSTAKALGHFSAVIWPRHGMVATGPDLSSALDLMETTDKMASIALNVLPRLRRP